MPNKSIGETLKELRLNAKLSQKQAYEFIGVAQSTFSSWEIGKAEPPTEVVLKLCRLYKIDNVLEAFGYNGYKEDGSLQLNLNETELIEKYRLLDPHGKEITDFVLNKEYDRCQAIQQEKVATLSKKPTRPIPTAAHADDYIHAPDDLKQLEEDIMDDENF